MGQSESDGDTRTTYFDFLNQAANDLSPSVPIRAIKARSELDRKLLEMIHKKS
jgi:hypothetical protein